MLHIPPELQDVNLTAGEKPGTRPEITRRSWVFLALLALLFLILAGRLLYLQVFQFERFSNLATQNYLRLDPVMAPRGIIYDSSGHVLVSNTVVYSVSILYSAVKDESQLAARLGAILGISPAHIEALIKQHEEAGDLYLPIRVATNVDQAVVNQIAENKIDLPGVILDTVPERAYPYDDLAGQVLGYVSDINSQELKAHPNDGYTLSDEYGQAGLENTYERYLKGTDGVREMEVDAGGHLVGDKGEEPPLPGDNLTLNLSASLTEVAQQALAAAVQNADKLGYGSKGGAVVLEDVHTGKILAMASYPSFNPAVLSPNPPPGESSNIFQDPAHPFLNRDLMAYPPGSTFKPAVATAALASGAITPKTEFFDPGYMTLGGTVFHNWYAAGFGYQNVVQAIQDSNDVFFYKTGLATGWQAIAHWAEQFGLGQPTGIDLPAEQTGVVPTQQYLTELYQGILKQREKALLAEYKGDASSPAYQEAAASLQKDFRSKYAFNMQWHKYDTVNMAIGQGYNLYTPLQMADYAATIANGGTLYRPYLVDRVTAPDGKVVLQNEPKVIRRLDLPPNVLPIVQEGMRLVTQGNGTAAALFAGFPIPVAAKTGTAQVPNGVTDSLFIAYAPANDPQVAAAAVVEHGWEGNFSAGPVVKAVLAAYFHVTTPAPPAETPVETPTPKPAPSGHTAPPPKNPQVAAVPPKTPPQPKTKKGR